jgi:hypothetical protein
MKKSASRFSFVLLAFALGLASVQFVRWALSDRNTDKSDRSTTEFDVDPSPLTRKADFPGFRFITRDCTGVNEYGGDTCVSGYENAALQKVWEFTVSHKDKKRAEREISLRIRDSLGIQNDSRMPARDDQRPFRRLELTTKTEDGTRTDIIRYNDANKIDVISADSADVAYEFEKWLNDGSPNK